MEKADNASGFAKQSNKYKKFGLHPNRNGSIEVHILIFEIYPTIHPFPGCGN
jgi:hypothetical protein